MREDNYPYWYHLHLNRFLLQPEQAGVSRLSQSFTIPVSQNAPTLSFRYRYQPEGSATLDPATLHISTAGQTHLLQTFVPVTTTQQAWFDMSRWAGQTVTVTFNVSATADARYGGLLQVGGGVDLASVLGVLAVFFATINIAGGFLVTERMLKMFRREDAPSSAGDR